MATENWVEVESVGLLVRVSNPCEGNYGHRRISLPCNEDNREHGHVLFRDSLEGGTGFVAYPCYSQEGLRLLFERGSAAGSDCFAKVVRDAAVATPEAQRLPTRLSSREKTLLDDSEALARFLHFGFWYEY